MARQIGVKNPSRVREDINEAHATMLRLADKGPNYVVRCPIHGIIGEAKRMGKRMRNGIYRCKHCLTGGLRWEAV